MPSRPGQSLVGEEKVSAEDNEYKQVSGEEEEDIRRSFLGSPLYL